VERAQRMHLSTYRRVLSERKRDRSIAEIDDADRAGPVWGAAQLERIAATCQPGGDRAGRSRVGRSAADPRVWSGSANPSRRLHVT